MKKSIISALLFGILIFQSATFYGQSPLPNSSGRKQMPTQNFQKNAKILAPAGSISVAENATINALTAEQLVQDVFVKGCLKASNIKYGYYQNTAGTWSFVNHTWAASASQRQLAHFTKGTSTFPLDEGLALTTGNAGSAMGPNNSNNLTELKVATASDPDLVAISGQNMYDASVLEFDFVPAGNTLEFKYVFTSEEYLEYCETAYNDAFGFFLSGPGIAGTFTNDAVNLATLPGNIPVSVNSIHPAGVNTNGTPFLAENETYYFSNPVGSLTMQYDGGTVVLTATYPVNPCNTYHIKLSIADATDQWYDAGVFLGARSFNADNIMLTNYGNFEADRNNVFEGCKNFLRVSRTDTDLGSEITIPLILSGTFTNGKDIQTPDEQPFPSTVTIPKGEAFVDIPYNSIDDGTDDNAETFIVQVAVNCPCDAETTYITTEINIYESVVIKSLNPTNTECKGSTGGSISVNAVGGSGTYLYSINGGATWQSLNNFTGLAAGDYTILVQDPGQCNKPVSATATVGSATAIVANAGPDVSICPGSSIQLNGSGGFSYSWSPSTGLNFDNIANPIASPASTTTYTLTVSSADGQCVDADKVTVTVEDIISPKIVCPVDLVLISDINNNCLFRLSQNYNTTATATDNCTNDADIVITYTLSGANTSGELLTLDGYNLLQGITTVTVIAYDLNGNKAICTFMIDVRCANNYVYGNIFDDGIVESPTNIINGSPINGSMINIAVTIHQNSTITMQTVPVSSTGTFAFAPVPMGNYEVVLHNSLIPVTIPSPVLPSGFSAFLGEGPSAGPMAGVADGIGKITIFRNSTPSIYSKVAANTDISFSLKANGPLPIRLVSFTGKATETGNLLKWETSSEINASHFEIERSSPLTPGDGINSEKFEKIGSTNMNESKNYEFQDSNHHWGNGSYYRLKMVDLDGKYSYSKIIYVENNAEKSEVGQFYPNPASGNNSKIDINTNEAGEWVITQIDITGKQLKSENKYLQKGFNQLEINDLKKGINFIQFINKGKVEVRKIIW
jgi:Secretion system C-terminal sorting domain/SprB repeat